MIDYIGKKCDKQFILIFYYKIIICKNNHHNLNRDGIIAGSWLGILAAPINKSPSVHYYIYNLYKEDCTWTRRECVKMSTTKGKNILILDDDEDLIDLFKTFLEYDGYKVVAFTDPIDALYSFRKNIYDLVLLDLETPKINGIILSHKLKNIDPTLLFCFITTNKKFIEHLKRNNLDIEKIVIHKSIWLNELRTKVHSLLFNQQQQKEDKDKLVMLIWLINRI